MKSLFISAWIVVAAFAQQNNTDWTVTNDNQQVVAVFPDVPRYDCSLSPEYGRIKSWKCVTKAGLSVSFQMIETIGEDSGKAIAKFLGPQFQLNLDRDSRQEVVSPTLIIRIMIPAKGLYVLKAEAKKRNLTIDEIGLVRKWGSDFEQAAKWLEDTTEKELKPKVVQAFDIQDAKGNVIARFPVKPDYAYRLEAIPRDWHTPQGDKAYVKTREWKCVNNGAIVDFCLYSAYEIEMTPFPEHAWQRARLVENQNLTGEKPPKYEKVSPNYIARVCGSYLSPNIFYAILSIETKGRDLTAADIAVYDSWSKTLPVGIYPDPPKKTPVRLDELQAYLLQQAAPPPNKAAGWPIAIGGKVVGQFPGKPVHHFELTKNQAKVQEWTSVVGQLKVSFFTITESGGRAFASPDVDTWFESKFKPRSWPGKGSHTFPLKSFLSADILGDVRPINYEQGKSGSADTAAILIVETKGKTLSRKELEWYDTWNGSIGDAGFEAVADFLMKNVK
jgi:hypothetical protein